MSNTESTHSNVEHLYAESDSLLHFGSEMKKEIQDLVCSIGEYIKSLEQRIQQFEDLAWLESADLLYFAVSSSGDTEAFLLCNDVFGYACADSEQVEFVDARYLRGLFERFSYEGIDAWIANKRNAEPIKERKTKGFLEALEYIQSPNFTD